MNARNPVFDAMNHPEQAPPIGLDTLFTTCEQLQQAGQAQEALDLYQSWLAQSQDANRHMAWFNYGSLQQSTGNPAAAIEAYKECLVLQPSFPQALINLGLTLEKIGKRDEALQQWATLVSKRLLKDGPSPDMLVLALNHIGRVHEDLKQYDLAEEALEQSLAPTINALMAADGVVMPCPPSALDFASSAQFWGLLNDVSSTLYSQTEHKKQFEFFNVLRTRVGSKTTSISVVRDWMNAAYGDIMLSAEVPESAATQNAAAEMSTIYDLPKGSMSSRTLQRAKDAYDDCVQEIEAKIVSSWNK